MSDDTRDIIDAMTLPARVHPKIAQRYEETLYATERVRRDNYVMAIMSLRNLADYLTEHEPEAAPLIAEIERLGGAIQDRYVGRTPDAPISPPEGKIGQTP